MNDYTALAVKDLVRTTQECVVVTLDVPEEEKSKFRFRQGQYLTVKATINGEEVVRSYSLCSSPLDEEWQIAVKKIAGGRFSTFANDTLRKGDTLMATPPNGHFFVDLASEEDQTVPRHYVAFAAGSGITPILSIIKTHLNAEPNSTFQLFYFNRTSKSIILKEELESLKNNFMERFQIFYFLTRERRSAAFFNGRLDTDKLDVIKEKLCDLKEVDNFFLCGPQAMINTVRDYLQEQEVQEEKIRFEFFNVNTDQSSYREELLEEFEGELCEVSIREGGQTVSFSIPVGSDNILDAAQEHHADLPFACKGGVCSTCKAKLLEGDVRMPVTYGLEQDQLDAGYILTCQAFPTSEKVVVDFDS